MVDSQSAFTKAMLAASTGINRERQSKHASALASQISTGSLPIGASPSGASADRVPSKGHASADRIPSKGYAGRKENAAGDDVNRNLRKHAVSGRCWARFIGLLEWWEDIEEPPRSGRLYSMVHSSLFENLSSAVILANCAFAGFVADWQIQHIGEHTAASMQVVEVLFLLFYCVEVALRLAVHGRYFFVNVDARWNSFDFCLLLLALDELVLSRLEVIRADTVNIGFLRILRLARMARILRTLRVMKVFKELAIILDSFKTCFVSLFWCFITMFFIFYVFALMMLQGMTSHLEESGDQMTEEEWASVRLYFDSLGTTILSLYMAVTGGDDWGNTFHVVKLGGDTYAALFLFFTFFFMFAVMNILTGVFVDKAMAAAAPSEEARILESQQQSMFEAATLRHLCQQMDGDGDGCITVDELQHHLTNDYFLAYLSSIGLNVRDPRNFFELLLPLRRKDSESIHLDALVEGFLAWKGTASTLDMQKQLLETEAVRKQLAAVEFKIFEAVQALEARIVQKEAKFPSHEGSEFAKKQSTSQTSSSKFPRQEDSECAKKQSTSQASSPSHHNTQQAATTEVEPKDGLQPQMPDSLQPKLGMTPPDDGASALDRLEKQMAVQQSFQPFLDGLRDEMMSGLVPEVAASIFYLLEARLSNKVHHQKNHEHRKDSPETRSADRSSDEAKVRTTPPQSEGAVLTSKRRRPPPRHEAQRLDQALRDAFTREARRSWPQPHAWEETRLVDMLRHGRPSAYNDMAGI